MASSPQSKVYQNCTHTISKHTAHNFATPPSTANCVQFWTNRQKRVARLTGNGMWITAADQLLLGLSRKISSDFPWKKIFWLNGNYPFEEKLPTKRNHLCEEKSWMWCHLGVKVKEDTAARSHGSPSSPCSTSNLGYGDASDDDRWWWW